MFGLGWLRDMVRIPDYVRQANARPDHEDYAKEYMKLTAVPPTHASHVLAMVMLGGVVTHVAQLYQPCVAPLKTEDKYWSYRTTQRIVYRCIVSISTR